MRELVLEAKLENLDTLLDFVATELETSSCGAKARTQIAMAVEEIFVNIVNYAYQTDGGQVQITLDAGKDVIIEFTDSGIPYDPLQKELPDITQSADDREIGGLGILMVRRMMDEVTYMYAEGKNILTLRKKAEGIASEEHRRI